MCKSCVFKYWVKTLLNCLSSTPLSLRLVLEKHTLMQLNLKLINTTAAHLLIPHHLPELIKSVPSHYISRKTNHSTTDPNKLQSFQLSTQATNGQDTLPDRLSQSRTPSGKLKSRWFLTCQELAGPTSPRPGRTPAQPRRGAWHAGAHRDVPPSRPRAGAHLRRGPAPPGPGPGPTRRQSNNRAVVAQDGRHARCRVVAR